MTGSGRMRIAAVLSAGALTGLGLLTGCGAGQVSQTADMVAAVPGGGQSASVAQGVVWAQNALVETPTDPNGYPAGGTAPIQVHITNNSQRPITLTGAQASWVNPGSTERGSATVVLTGGTATPPAPASPSAAASGSATASGSAAPAGSGSATPSAAASPTSAGSSTVTVQVPVAARVDLVRDSGSYLQLDQLSAPLGVGALVNLVLTFQTDQGQQFTITVPVPVAPSTAPAQRSPLTMPTPSENG